MDLFTPVVGEKAQHPYFRSIWKQANGFNCDVLNEWARGFKDRDGKFVKEFQTTFDSGRNSSSTRTGRRAVETIFAYADSGRVIQTGTANGLPSARRTT